MRRLIRLQYRLILILIVVFTTIAFACSSEPQKATVPAHLEEIENLTIFSGGDSPKAEINFEREISIGDSPEQPIGRFGGFAVDDTGRIWIATIIENFSVHEWWILEETGELITKFEWPRDEPIEVVKNGKMYTRQTEEETGLQQVVRYRLEMGS